MGLGVFLTIKSCAFGTLARTNPVASGKTLPVGEARSISLLCCREYVTKGVIAALAGLSATESRQPITIQPQAGEEESVLFARLWCNQELLKADYNAQTDWKALAQQAIAVVRGIPSS